MDRIHPWRIVSRQPTPDGTILHFESADPNALADEVHRFFTAEGYRLEEGSPTSAVYGIGGGGMRLLFGGLSKRYRFRIQIHQEGQHVKLVLSKAMSGASGGLLGYSQMKSETERISQAIASLAPSSMASAHPPSPSAVPLSAVLAMCSSCGHENASSSLFCTNCGQRLSNETRSYR